MNDRDFLKECLGYISESYEEYQCYQQKAFEILEYFSKICKVNDITYYLAFGTLLGAIRDKGIIPWDYDIDVWVPFSMKARLLESLNEDNSSRYSWISADNNPQYSSTCLKIYLFGRKFTSIHIDVYFLVGFPEDEKRQTALANKINSLKRIRKRKYHHLWFPEKKGVFPRLVKQINVIRTSLISKKVLRQNEEKVMTAYPYNGSNCLYSIGDPYEKVYQAADFCGVKSVIINGVEFSIPSGYENILKDIYGDFRTYPPIQKRFEEFYKMLSVIREREKQ